ncbi:hypothetical protein HYFRA_00003112 [Hymenoscyphus fraxineus]|uniref:BTB domain transcription factor n=1 Tax=Hymenoscyphus fraxineus TaxID=746836 RepID=A0A9N9KRP0_9HELO|nr:hypothetical protein HYFRA_00003112 [Hymenoscyphus fraxineus]
MAGKRGSTKSSSPVCPGAPKMTKNTVKKRSAAEVSSSPVNDGQPKKKRGRPSKADLLARQQSSENGNGDDTNDAQDKAEDEMEGVVKESIKEVDNVKGDANGAASPTDTPKKKRGRPSKADLLARQQASEESTTGESKKEENVKNGEEENGEKPAEDGDEMTGVEANGHTNGSHNGDEAGKAEEHTNGTNGKLEGEAHEEKNAFDLVKSGLNDENLKPKEKSSAPSPEPKAPAPIPSAEPATATEGEKNTEPKEETNPQSDTAVKDFARQDEIPSSILEKGIIYFFFRSRVNVDEPQGIEDVARSYIVLRPLPLGAKISEGTLADDGNARLLALPKKKLPEGGKDRFLVFVEKKGVTVKELREQLSGDEYATKTQGTTNVQPATPFAEGIYAITSTTRESHLAYHITVPEKVGEIQNELGLKQKGSFVVSAKNPETGNGNVGLENPAKYPEELQKKFRGLRWMPLIPELLEYENTQFLVIGEAAGNMDKALEEMKKDEKDETKEKPEEEVEKLVEEDHDRVASLKEDDPIFADLGLSAGEHNHLTSTW